MNPSGACRIYAMEIRTHDSKLINTFEVPQIEFATA